MESIIGAVGGMGLFTKIEFEFADTQPLFKLVTVKVYELTGKPEKDVVSPIPVWVKVLAGEFPYAVMVHPPELGKFEMATDPVARAQVGWVTIPAIGVDGTLGIALMLTEEVNGEVQPTNGSRYSNENAVAGVSPEIAAIVPTPDCVKPAGTEFMVHPVLGRPER
jgi:hypothetical protein